MGGGPRPPDARGVSQLSLDIRKAAESDIADVLWIEQASFADAWSQDAFLTSLESGHMRFLVAQEDPGTGDSRLVGYVIAIVMASDAEIADIAVAHSHRGRGVGGVLLDRVTADLREFRVKVVYLEVRESNVAARALYKSRAFRQVGRRKRYYQLPVEDALILRRDLESE